MVEKIASTDITLIPYDNARLLNLCGKFDEHLRQIEQRLDIEIKNRGNAFVLTGNPREINVARIVLNTLYKQTEEDEVDLTPSLVHLAIQQVNADMITQALESNQKETEKGVNALKTPIRVIKPRSKNQMQYINKILTHDINFGIGPAGSGKTYLAVACAVHALESQLVRRIILVRPVVEAGERLGFLPGDLTQKIDPYLRPLYDAFHDMIDFEKVNKMLESQVIEIAPLAYMRGRTLNDAFIILDEGQNTTCEQMKMFLTRIGFNSTAVITGDITQVDLPHGKISGLRHAREVLKDIEEISFTNFHSADIVRHQIVQKIVDSYAVYEKKRGDV